MLSTTNLRVTNLIAMMLKLTGIGRLLAWLLPTHCLHSLGILPSFQRAFRQCVGHVQAMVALPRGLLAWLVSTDCLRSLGNWPSFHRALRQYAGNPEAIYRLYDNAWQRPDGNAFNFGSLYKDLLHWTGQAFLSPLKQIEMVISKRPGADKIMNDAAFERTWENMSGSGWAGKAASVVRDLTAYAKDTEMQSRLLTVLKRTRYVDMVSKRGEGTVTNGDQSQLRGLNFKAGVSLMSSFFVRCPISIDRATGLLDDGTAGVTSSVDGGVGSIQLIVGGTFTYSLNSYATRGPSSILTPVKGYV